MLRTCPALPLTLGVLRWTHRSFARERGPESFEAEGTPVARLRDPVIADSRLRVEVVVLSSQVAGVDASEHRSAIGSDGATDALGFWAFGGRAEVRDPRATVLHRPGLGRERLTCRDSGRHPRRAEASGEVVEEVTLC